jgi:hypothetical protein
MDAARLIVLSLLCLPMVGGCQRQEPVESAIPRQAAPVPSAEELGGDGKASPVQFTPGDWFEDATADSGVHFTYHNGSEAELYTILETVGGGVALVDFDRDGDLDLFFPGGGTISADPPEVSGLPCAYFQNDGTGRFIDASRDVGLNEISFDYSHGVTACDYDRDGWPDLLVTCYGRSRLLRNEAGRRFVDATESARLDLVGFHTAAAWADIVVDGRPDLFVVGYVDWKLDPTEACVDPQSGQRDACPPQRYGPTAQRVFRNRADGTFEDISAQAGVRTDGKGLGVVAADLNADGYADFYVANDQVLNHCYLGGPQLPLKEVGEESGTAFNEYGLAEGSMGVDVGDYNGDGTGDLFVTNFEMEDNSLYVNRGEGLFRHATVSAGLGGQGRTLVGFGTALADFDSDVWLDIVTFNGHVFRHRGLSPYRQEAFLLRSDAGQRFAVVAEAGSYFRVPHAGRGAAVGDLNNDGALDLVIVHQNEPVAVLMNRRPPESWIGVELRGETCDPEAIGAIVEFHFAGRTVTRHVRSGAGYLSQFDPRIVVPQTGAEPVAIVVRWPGGPRERFSNLRSRTYQVVHQGTGDAVP